MSSDGFIRDNYDPIGRRGDSLRTTGHCIVWVWPQLGGLRAGVDYPTDLSDFDWFFPDQEACERCLE